MPSAGSIMSKVGFAADVRDVIRTERAQARSSAPAVTDAVTDAATGGANVDAYIAFLAQMFVIDELLERAAEAQRRSPIASRFVVAELHRAAAVESDLRWLAGDRWREAVRITPATEAYVDRLREVVFTWPGGFIAHYALRYLDAPGHDHRWADLDAVPWSAAERARIVDEVRRAVRLNAAVLEDLADRQPDRAA
jgi:heme oxygenase (biliverdin-producing, ferredoxin)